MLPGMLLRCDITAINFGRELQMFYLYITIFYQETAEVDYRDANCEVTLNGYDDSCIKTLSHDVY